MSLRAEIRGPVTTLVIDRPERRNAIDRAHAADLADAVRRFDADDAQAVLVLTGVDGCFSAGADLQAIAAGAPNRISPEGDAPLGASRLRVKKPTIAAVEGHAVAGGLELALWCDLRVASETAVFGVFCRRFGVPLIDGGTARLPRLIGLSRALDLILTGRPVPAREAGDIGLANRVVPAGCARAEAEALADRLAAFPRRCLEADLASARAAFDRPLDDALIEELLRGREVIEAESVAGAERFARGAGRHGAFDEEG
jgi:enoyl-CoA hydratase